MQLPKSNAFDHSIPPPYTYVTVTLSSSSHLRVLCRSILCHGPDRAVGYRHRYFSREMGIDAENA